MARRTIPSKATSPTIEPSPACDDTRAVGGVGDLHDEAVAVHVRLVATEQRDTIETLFKQGRWLETGNPRRSALGADFGRLGIALIPVLAALGNATIRALEALDRLVDFRNAVSHGNETEITALVSGGLIKATKASYAEYRKTLDRLAGTIDAEVAATLAARLQIPAPW